MNVSCICGGHLWQVPGFTAYGTHTGLKRKRPDLTIIKSERLCSAAAVYTKNKVVAPPLLVTRAHLADGYAQAIVCNSGIANACTGTQGMINAHAMAQITAELLGLIPEDVVVASTGVIGEQLPMEKMASSIKTVAGLLGTEQGTEAAEGIMTTDTVPKEVLYTVDVGGHTVSLAGIAKGSGMIHPNMATMLAFIVTDVSCSPDVLHDALTAATDKTFNMISVDGDTSTNDMVVVLANGEAGNPPLCLGTPGFAAFSAALDAVCEDLAKRIAADGEGATKLFEVQVVNAPTVHDARAVGKAVVASSLVKAAVHGGDPNWGRIMCAAGYSGAEVDIDASRLVLCSGGECLTLFEDGTPCDYGEHEAVRLMSGSDLVFIIDFKTGSASAKAWGCDLTNEYVNINAHYRT